MSKLFAEINNPTGYTVNLESNKYPAIKVLSASQATGLQRFPVVDRTHFDCLRHQLVRALPHCSAISIQFRDESEVAEEVERQAVLALLMSAAPDRVVLGEDARSEITITVTLDNLPLANQVISLSSTHGELGAEQGATDENGLFVTSIAAAIEGVATITATVGDQVQETSVAFVAADVTETGPATGDTGAAKTGDATGEEKTPAPKKATSKKSTSSGATE